MLFNIFLNWIKFKIENTKKNQTEIKEKIIFSVVISVGIGQD